MVGQFVMLRLKHQFHGTLLKTVIIQQWVKWFLVWLVWYENGMIDHVNQDVDNWTKRLYGVGQSG